MKSILTYMIISGVSLLMFSKCISTSPKPVETCGSDIEEFDYFANNWNVVGLKDYTYGTRITPNNEIVLSGKTAVQIRFGHDGRPLSRTHGKLAMHGWMPIMLVNAKDGPVHYKVTIWATPLPDVKDWKKAYDWPTEGENYLTWIQVRAFNTSDVPMDAMVEIGPNGEIEIPKTTEPQVQAKTDKVHSHSYSWSWKLKPQNSVEATARYPFFPVDDPKKYEEEDAKKWLKRTEGYWQDAIARTTDIKVPSRKASEAFLAAHVCQYIASDHGELRAGEDFYDRFYPRDGAYQVMELEEAGLSDASRNAIELFLRCQQEDGRFRGGGNQVLQLDANGQTQWALWQYFKITNDKQWLKRVYPQMLRAARWTIRDRKQAPAGTPFSGLVHNAPADGESLWTGEQHIVGYDLWNLRGMLCTADAARILFRGTYPSSK